MTNGITAILNNVRNIRYHRQGGTYIYLRFPQRVKLIAEDRCSVVENACQGLEEAYQKYRTCADRYAEIGIDVDNLPKEEDTCTMWGETFGYGDDYGSDGYTYAMYLQGW
ncbi:MAG: hypothetical protein ABI234_06265 [Ktedonobacteraceae bacterium]